MANYVCMHACVLFERDINVNWFKISRMLNKIKIKKREEKKKQTPS